MSELMRRIGVKRAATLTLIMWAFGNSAAGAQQPQTPPAGTTQTPPAGTGVQSPPPGGTVATGPGRGRPTPPQPQQKQGVEYLTGTWDFTWTGRESPITAGPRAGTVTFTRRGTSNTLDVRSEGKVEDGGAAYKESGSAEWNEADKTLAFKETLANGTTLTGNGNWSSPLAIRYESQPAQVGKQSVKVRRTYQIISGVSFTVAEELSVDGGPFQRLGNGTYSKKQ
jgi:hypothetical protein